MITHTQRQYTTINDIANRLGVSWNTVKRILKELNVRVIRTRSAHLVHLSDVRRIERRINYQSKNKNQSWR